MWPDRFWSKVAIGKPDWCWPWMAATTHNGYGVTSAPGRVKKLAHRVAYELQQGPIPVGLQLDHLCRNRACCNPCHLEPVTQAENLRRGNGPAVTRERHAATTHCPAGHAYDAGNTYRGRNGKRMCMECHRFRNREYARRVRRAS